ncbi:MAG TPA: hypothetical protein PLV92_26680, partial [Pirellulaceae bacterium]|nr:hypothetical protein [Pirellulaceae bacterium]
DGAEAQRWIAIPGDGQARLANDSKASAVFPDGTVLVKQLNLPGVNGNSSVRLETQILHFEDGTWRPYSYRWDDAGVDAILVDGAVGASRPLRLGPKNDPTGALAETYDRTWHVNATNECKLCHNAGAKFVLGFVPQQLDRALAGSTDGAGNGAGGQLAALAGRGIIAAAPQLAADDPLRLVDPHDAAGSLDDRARSYLHVNCSMCHHLGGNAIVSFYLRRDMPFEKLNTYKGTGIGTFGLRDAKLIVPGDPYRSVLMYRMSKLGYARMPYIGSRVVDGAGVALIEQWIRGMTPKAGDVLSGPATSGSDDAVAVAALSAKSDQPQDRREAAVARLLKSTEGSLALIAQLHRGSLSRQDASAAVIFASRVGSTDIRGLFDTFIPESQRRPTLGPKIDPQVVLSRTGDVQ